MDQDSILKWLLAPTGAAAALLTWLFRRRLSGSWIGRRLAAEQALARCQEELRDQRSSFDRQEATLIREIAARDREVATRDREIGYLMAALARLNNSAAEVIEVHNAGLLTTLDPSPTAHSPSPAPSPSSPAKPLA